MRCDDDGDEEETALIDSCLLIINLPSWNENNQQIIREVNQSAMKRC